MSNQEIMRALALTAKLMELHGENDFKARAYSNAAFQLKKVGNPLAEMEEGEMAAIKGVGKSTAKKIVTYLTTGQFEELQHLVNKTPAGVMEMLQIKGLGPKKIRLIWQELEVESLGALLYACHENRLAQTKGFGMKTQENVIKSIEFFNQQKGYYHFANVEQYANEIVLKIKDQFSPSNISFTADYRRKAITLNTVDILISPPELRDHNWGSVVEVESIEHSENQLLVKQAMAPDLRIHFCSAENFEQSLFETSATEEHLRSIGWETGADFSNESSVYEEKQLPFIIPEMREGKDEVISRKQFGKQRIIQPEDIKGVVHNHSNWSDGLNSIEEMALACQEMGYEYLVMSDHSKTAVYANGLQVERVLAQMQEIDELNQKLDNFKIFKSIESDILNDGSLDYDDDILAKFDLVIASVHSNLRMDEEKAMERLIQAIEHPATRILGHMTGRLLLSRKGYPVNHQKIIDACAANGTIIELNANPHRLDVDWQHIYACMNKGVMISINPDAHSIGGIQHIKYGVYAAQKGGLTKNCCLNAKNLSAFEAWVNNKSS